MKGEGKLKVETAQSGMTALEIKTEALEKAKKKYNEYLFYRESHDEVLEFFLYNEYDIKDKELAEAVENEMIEIDRAITSSIISNIKEAQE